MNKVQALLATLAVMKTAESANAMDPTRLTDDNLDTITAGLNIDTPYLNMQTNCSNCIVYDTVRNGRKFSDAFAFVYSFDNPDGPATGVAASYAGPLRIVGAALATGSGPSGTYGNVGASSAAGAGEYTEPFYPYTRAAFASAGVNNGTAATVAYDGPLGIVQAGAALAEGEPPHPNSVGVLISNRSLLSIDGLGGNLVLPSGNGRQLQIEGRVSTSAPGL